MVEPCPFCGARVVPIKLGHLKECPSCGGRWYEGGGFGAGSRYGDEGGGSAAAAVA